MLLGCWFGVVQNDLQASLLQPFKERLCGAKQGTQRNGFVEAVRQNCSAQVCIGYSQYPTLDVGCLGDFKI